MSITTELWANPASSTTVSSGGTTAPAQGTSESWTMAGGYAGFPAASSTAAPPTQFHVIDPAQPTEIIAVTNVSGSTWTVTRGAESTTPVAHASGFTVQQTVSAGGLKNFLQSPSGDGINLPSAGLAAAVTYANNSAANTPLSLSVPANEPVAGSVYEIELFGYYATASVAPTLAIVLNWGSTAVGNNTFTLGASVAASARIRVHAILTFVSATTCYASTRVDLATSGAVNTACPQYMFGPNSGATTVTTSSAQNFGISFQWGTASASNTLTIAGGKVWKAA